MSKRRTCPIEPKRKRCPNRPKEQKAQTPSDSSCEKGSKSKNEWRFYRQTVRNGERGAIEIWSILEEKEYSSGKKLLGEGDGVRKRMSLWKRGLDFEQSKKFIKSSRSGLVESIMEKSRLLMVESHLLQLTVVFGPSFPRVRKWAKFENLNIEIWRNEGSRIRSPLIQNRHRHAQRKLTHQMDEQQGNESSWREETVHLRTWHRFRLLPSSCSLPRYLSTFVIFHKNFVEKFHGDEIHKYMKNYKQAKKLGLINKE